MKFVEKVAAKISDKSPELLLGFGIVSIGVGIFAFCKATLKNHEDIQEYKSKIDDLKLKYNEDQIIDTKNNDGKNLPEITHNYKKELSHLYFRMGLNTCKNYAIGSALVLGGMLMIFKGNSIKTERINTLKDQVANLTIANTSLQACLDRLHKNIKEEYGEEVDKKLTYGLSEKDIETVDEKGKKVKKKVTVCDDSKIASPYARWFKNGCPGWENNNTLNLSFLIAQEEFANIKLKAQGYLYLNDVYKALGFNEDPVMGWRAGWIYDENDPNTSVNFNIFDSLFKPNQDFVNGDSNEVLLDFNCQSDIWKELYLEGKGSGNPYRDMYDYPNGI